MPARQRISAFLRRFRRARHGGIALNFALIALPLAVLSLGLIDVNRASMSKRSLQDALDAAALIVAKSSAMTDADANTIGAKALAAQLASMSADSGALGSATFRLSGTNKNTVIADANMSVTPVVANLWLQGNMSIGAHSEVVRAAYSLEVAMVLDLTGSMGGSRLTDLKTAAKDLVDLVVKDVQTPYYSKVSLVPYSMGVRLSSSNADTARGAPVPAKTITGASWASGSSKGISGITRDNPAVVTANNHGFENGDRVYITGVKGMTQVNGKVYTVANKTNNTFQLAGVRSSYYSNYQSSGNDTATKCQATDCEVVITSSNHGFSNNDWIYITGVGGMSDINYHDWKVVQQTSNSFWLDGSFGPDYSSFSSNGSAWCTEEGCQYQRFTNKYSGTVIQQISNCVTERTGNNKQTDVSPATSPVGRNYPSSGNPCISSSIVGLSSDKTALKSTITNFEAEGSTAGQIGLEWGWFSVSPNFTSIFGGSSAPAAYGTKDLMKVVILMTDGEFNTAYCKGVIAQDSGNGSGSDSAKVNCNASNGDGYTQAAAMCAAMKQKGVVIYTVGFDISDSTAVTGLLNGCATSGKAYLPNNGTALKEAFKAIGQDISSLRISK